MSAGLGLDMTEFQRGMQKATEVARSNSTLMSAEMKATAREGAESFRLIDEALGIHVSRPITKILTKEFPDFAKALQGLFGAGLTGAVGVIAVENIERFAKKIEEAKAAQEKWGEASRKSEEVFGDAMAEIQKKIAEVNGVPVAVKFNMEGAETARHAINAVSEALLNEAKAAEEAAEISTKAWAGVGDVISGAIQGIALALPDALGGAFLTKALKDSEQATNLNLALKAMKENLDDVLRADAAKGTHNALALISEDLARIEVNLRAMQAAGNTAGVAIAEAGKKLFEDSQKIEVAAQKLAAAQTAKANNDEALKAQTEAAEKLSALYKEMGSSLAKLQPETDPIKKLETEIEGFRATAEADFRAIGASAASALATRAALAGLDSYEKKLDLLKIKLESDIFAKQAQELFSKPLVGLPTGAAVPGLITAATAAAPTLGAGGTVGAQFDVFKADQAAQLKAAAAAYQDMLGPQQKFDLQQQELNLLLKQELIDQTAFTAAMQKAREELAQTSDKLEMLLKKTGDASAGFQAFMLQLQKDANRDGAFVFDILNKGLDGFENNLVQTLTGGKAEWRKYFEELAQMALKFELNKLIAGGLGKLGGIFGAAGNGAVTQAAATQQVTAGTLMQAAAAQQLTAATIMASSGIGAAAGAAASEATTAAANFGGALASGGDLTPGMNYVVGEQGPEPLSVDASGKAFISPHSSLSASGGGGSTHNHYYDLRGADPAVVQRLVAALPQVEERAVARAVATSSEVSRRTANY